MATKNDIRKVARKTRRSLFGVSGPIDDLKDTWDNAIAEFQAKRAELDSVESQLYSIQYEASLDPADWEEWQSVFSKVNAAISTMDAIAGTVNTIVDYWDSFTGLFGVRSKAGLSGALGLLPALPITLGGLAAVVAGATAAITAAYGFIAYINAKTGKFQQYVDAGMDLESAAEQARKDAEKESGYSIGARIERVVMFASLAVVAAFLVPRLMKKG